ncbi:MAG TPA: M61 family peptidase [Candidatus Dormibacteraeota bacterium]|nr:M61 family peptidase [Candidatus Dormibacteraeota bacterium]
MHSGLRWWSVLVPTLSLLLAGPFLAAQAIRLHVDLTDAPRNIYHAHLQIPVHAGDLSLVFPKWIPGNHRPSGPIGALTGVRMEAGHHPISWQRDSAEMYEFHVTVPDGVDTLDVSLDAITSQDSAGGGGPAASANLLDLNWNAVVLYPKGTRSDDVSFAPSVTLPAGWKFGTALPVARTNGDEVEFSPVSLTTLIDSPLIAGAHYRKVDLTKAGESPTHVMDLVADAEPDLAITPKDVAAYQKLVAETGALFGARHYRHYDFLLTLSDQVGGHGLEHHESNDSVAGERALVDPDVHMLYAGLVPHEFVHSWNGKYRRPAGLATPNYQQPMIGDLLWVYEGLTEYLGNLLAERSGLWTDEQYREALASTAAMLDHRSGRTWRPLGDTARSVQTLRMMGSQWQNWRRSLDYYPEGELIWLDVDSILRQQTHGQRSLNDFCRRFHGGESGPPKVVPYTFDDVVHALNDVAPYDWAHLLHERVDATTTHAPLGGIERGGWKLVYNDKPNVFTDAIEKLAKFTDFSYSLGFTVGEDGKLDDVIVGSPAYQSGVGPAMKLVAVNGRKWSPEVLHAAIKAAQGSNQPIELLVENAQFFKTHSVAYYDGEKNPHLERVSSQPDILGDILKPLTP